MNTIFQWKLEIIKRLGNQNFSHLRRFSHFLFSTFNFTSSSMENVNLSKYNLVQFVATINVSVENLKASQKLPSAIQSTSHTNHKLQKKVYKQKLKKKIQILNHNNGICLSNQSWAILTDAEISY